jgi:hypothetical protein
MSTDTGSPKHERDSSNRNRWRAARRPPQQSLSTMENVLDILSNELESDACHDARMIAAEIADNETLHTDLVFSDAMHVAVALALEDADMPYTKANAAWMFDRIHPAEVREILLYRRDYPEQYAMLPKAGALENLTTTQMESASAITETLGADRLNAMFFCDTVGTA